MMGPTTFSDVRDLTHPLFEGFPNSDGSKWFTKEPFLTFAKDKLNINKWTLMEHTGTHMDAPLHFSADGKSVDLIPITDLVVPLAVIDISKRAQDNPDAAVTPDDIKAWEAKNGLARRVLRGDELRLGTVASYAEICRP